MKNLFIKVLGTSLLYAATTFAQSATEIAKKVHDLPSGKTSSATISVTLIDKQVYIPVITLTIKIQNYCITTKIPFWHILRLPHSIPNI